MRQAGVLAAAGLVALKTMPHRLEEDHANASFLAQGLAALPGITLDLNSVQTNIVICDLKKTGLEPTQFISGLEKKKVFLSVVLVVTESGLPPIKTFPAQTLNTL